MGPLSALARSRAHLSDGEHSGIIQTRKVSYNIWSPVAITDYTEIYDGSPPLRPLIIADLHLHQGISDFTIGVAGGKCFAPGFSLRKSPLLRGRIGHGNRETALEECAARGEQMYRHPKSTKMEL